MKLKIVFALLFLVALLAACGGGQPQISVETESFSFGDVVNGDIVTRDLVVQNKGSAPLVVESVSTSCGCTKATLEPMTIPPGESGVLHLEFDSGAHGPDANGTLTRMIFIASNDPQQPELRIEFTAEVLPRS